MKILLFGEYSGLHTFLQTGLKALGHETKLLSCGDGFKNLKGDININTKIKNRYIRAIYIRLQYFLLMPFFINYDIVQFISLEIIPLPFILKKLYIKYLLLFNKKVILNCCSGNAVVITHSLANMKYSPFQNEIKEKYYNGTYKMIGYKKLLNDINLSQSVSGIITTSYMYDESYKDYKNYLGFVPMPIVTQDNIAENICSGKIKILFGITRPIIKGAKEIRKALDNIKEKYPFQVEVQIIEKISFEEYNKYLKDCNILIDQACSYDYGMNALLAMAQKKVVLSGSEPEVEKIMKSKCPVINIRPEVNHIVFQLEALIQNTDRIESIGRDSYEYVKQYHNHISVSQQYILKWSQTNHY